MPSTDRREFLKRASQGAAATALASAAARAAAPSERLTVAVIGPGGMGSHHVELLSKNSHVQLAYVCDVDETRLAGAAAMVERNSGKAPQAVKDMRRIFDDKSVDADLHLKIRSFTC